ncbi:MAG: hypothetical protein NTX53_13400 [candidate division WOR-3 bacterium]|nr:hypothetical protein [candidate division WOR-3 bacterium]
MANPEPRPAVKETPKMVSVPDNHGLDGFGVEVVDRAVLIWEGT